MITDAYLTVKRSLWLALHYGVMDADIRSILGEEELGSLLWSRQTYLRPFRIALDP